MILMKPSRTAGSLWIINTATITATVAAYIWCSYTILQSFQSIFLASAIFSLQWFGPICLYGFINNAFRLRAARSIVVTSLCIILLTIPLQFLDVNPMTPFIVVLVIGAAEAVIKIARLALIKEFVPPNAVGQVNSFTVAGQFIGGALGGVLFAVTTAQSSSFWLPTISLILLSISLAAATLLPSSDHETPPPPRSSVFVQFRGTLSAIVTDVGLRRALIGLVGVCSLVQGFHNVARVGLPIEQWRGDQGTVGILQTVVALTTVVGAAIYIILDRKTNARTLVMACSVCTALAMIGVTIAVDPILGLALYAALIFFFELIFLHYQANAIKNFKHNEASAVFTFQFLIINLGIFGSGLAGGAIAEVAGFTVTALIFVAGFLVSICFALPRNS